MDIAESIRIMAEKIACERYFMVKFKTPPLISIPDAIQFLNIINGRDVSDEFANEFAKAYDDMMNNEEA